MLKKNKSKKNIKVAKKIKVVKKPADKKVKKVIKKPKAIAKKIRPMDEKVLAVVRSCMEKKAKDIVVLDMRNLTDIADYFIICSGSNTRQTVAIADNIQYRLNEIKVKPDHIEGLPGGSWVLLDYRDMIIHVFLSQTRDFYKLEELWADAKKIKFTSKSKV